MSLEIKKDFIGCDRAISCLPGEALEVEIYPWGSIEGFRKITGVKYIWEYMRLKEGSWMAVSGGQARDKAWAKAVGDEHMWTQSSTMGQIWQLAAGGEGEEEVVDFCGFNLGGDSKAFRKSFEAENSLVLEAVMWSLGSWRAWAHHLQIPPPSLI